MLWLALLPLVFAQDPVDEVVIAAAASCGVADEVAATLGVEEETAARAAYMRRLSRAWETSEVDPLLLGGRRWLLARCLVASVTDTELHADTAAGLGELTGAARRELAGERLFAAVLGRVEGGALAAAADLDGLLELLSKVPQAATMLRDEAAWDAGLSDGDGDGLTALAEALAGSDPERWDSDGDGWWDGAPSRITDAAQVLPRDGTFACMPVSPKREERAVRHTWRRAADGQEEHLGKLTSEGSVVMGPSSPPEEGPTVGFWATWEGEGLRLTGDCVATAHVTVRLMRDGGPPLGLEEGWAADKVSERGRSRALLAEVADAVEGLWPDAEAALGGIEARAYVRIGGSDTRSMSSKAAWPFVELDPRDLALMRRKFEPEVLAAVVLALHRLALDGRTRLATLEAALSVTGQLTEHKVPPSLLGALPAATKGWDAAARACPTGWMGLLDRSCRLPR